MPEHGWNDVIREAIRASGLTLYAVAQKTGLNVAPLQRFMAGTHGVSVRSAEKIGRVVGLELRRVKRRAKTGDK